MSTLAVPQILRPQPVENRWQNKLFNVNLVFDEKSSQITFRIGQVLKRAVDITASTLGMVVLSPMLIAIGTMIAFSSPGPVIYKSPRIGKNGKPFSMYKFRTMCNDADHLREKMRKENNLEGELFKIENDPRITRVGYVLRKYSLDEFPQLLNVIRGEMSLVGPRPLPPDESALFEAPYTLRFEVKPGVTGLWQVSGRSNLSFKQLCELELSYTLNWSLWKDLQILIQTIPAVLIRKGAY